MILQGEITYWSLLGVKGVRATIKSSRTFILRFQADFNLTSQEFPSAN